MTSPAHPAASPWEFAPLFEAELWREGVPEEKQAVVERAFDTATKGISSFLDHARFGSSRDADEGLPFKATTSLSARPKHGGAIRVFTQPARPGSEGENAHRAAGDGSSSTSGRPTAPPVIFGAYYVPGCVSDVDQFVGRNAARSRWDPFCKSAEVKHRHNAACVEVRQEFHPRLVFSGREQWLICAGRRLKNGGSLFVSASLPDAWVPPPAKHLVRSHQLFAAHYVLPRANDCAADDEEAKRRRKADAPSFGFVPLFPRPPISRYAGAAYNAFAPEPCDGSAFPRDRFNAAECPSTAMVSVAQIDLNNGMPRWFYYFVAVQFARVMRNFRRGVAASKDDERWWDFGADQEDEDDKED
jgi:hypothetical protein